MCKLLHVTCVNLSHVLQDSDYYHFEYDVLYLKVGTSVKDDLLMETVIFCFSFVYLQKVWAG